MALPLILTGISLKFDILYLYGKFGELRCRSKRLDRLGVKPLSHLRTDAADRSGCSIRRDPRRIRTVSVDFRSDPSQSAAKF